jgi:hypothetical protein
VALRVVDPAEETLPDVGVVLLEDPETGEQIEVDTSRRSISRSYAKHAEDRLRDLGRLFGARGIDLLELHTDRDYLPVLRGFFERRGRRMTA